LLSLYGQNNLFAIVPSDSCLLDTNFNSLFLSSFA
jgi:hypothetical protein